MIAQRLCTLATLGCAVAARRPPAAAADLPLPGDRAPTSAIGLYLAGRRYQEQGRYQLAIEAYRQLLGTEPGSVSAHNALGVIYSRQHQAQLAEQEFAAALAIEPDAAQVHNNLASAREASQRLPTSPGVVLPEVAVVETVLSAQQRASEPTMRLEHLSEGVWELHNLADQRKEFPVDVATLAVASPSGAVASATVATASGK